MCQANVKLLTPPEIKELQKLYESHVSCASHVYSLTLIYFKWKKLHPEKDYIKFYVLGDDWRKSGTFLMVFRNYDIFMFTFDKSGTDLYSLLNKSQILKAACTWNKAVLYGIRNRHLPPIYKSLKESNIPIKATFNNKLFFLPKEQALQYTISCPEEVYIDKLNLNHIELICSLWPHAFPGADDYLSSFIEMNGGFGVFLKENDQLVSWIMQNHWGTLITLETVPEYKRRGYGSLIVKRMCVKIAKEGINPMCTILTKNHASQSLFLKLGFKIVDDCTYICIQ